MVQHKMKCYIIAGPNGAGKTTFAENFLPVEAECLNFINADLIAKGIAPFNPESVALESGKLFLSLKAGIMCRKMLLSEGFIGAGTIFKSII